MPRPEKWIPLCDVKGLATLIHEGKSQQEIAEYYSAVLPYHIDKSTISRRLKEKHT
jgi:hypothetical protein